MEGAENPCGFAQVSESSWYMQQSACNRANAAFSLYGVLRGDDDLGCTKASYINSFYTTTGVETFVEALTNSGYAFSGDGDGADVTSDCESSFADDEGGNDNNNAFVQGDEAFAGATSNGLSCTGSHFHQKSFQGAYCNNGRADYVTDDLSNFNVDLEKVQCAKIYDYYSNNNNGENNGDGLELLYYSKSCKVRESGDTCPDPYGKLRQYEKSRERNSVDRKVQRRERFKRAISWILLTIGVVMIICSLFLCCERSTKRTRKRGDGDGYSSDDEPKTSRLCPWRRKTRTSSAKTRRSWWRRNK